MSFCNIFKDKIGNYKELIDNTEYLSDLIVEGIDQTRGWFYSLLVLSTALFNKPAYKTVICSGLILAEDGKKLIEEINIVKSEVAAIKEDMSEIKLLLSKLLEKGSNG